MNKKILNEKFSHNTSIARLNKISDAIRFSFKQGLIAFFALLFALGVVEIVGNAIGGRSSKIIDLLDFAIAGLGFLLMFLAKFFEQLSRKHKL